VPPTLFGRADEVPYPKASLTLDDIGCNDPLSDLHRQRSARSCSREGSIFVINLNTANAFG